VKGFIVTRQWRDTDTGVEIELWLATDCGAQKILVPEQESIFFIARDDQDKVPPLLGLPRGWRMEELPLRSFTNRPVMGVYFKSHKRARDAARLLRRHMPVWEADIRPSERYLMERFIRSSVELVATEPRPVIKPTEYSPDLSIVSLDIETDMSANELYSIGVFAQADQRVFMVGEPEQAAASSSVTVEFFASESECILAFLKWCAAVDPDVIIGWNLIDFDFWVLTKICQRLGIEFSVGRENSRPVWRIDRSDNDRKYLFVPGRLVLDGIELLRSAFYQFESFALEFVARQLLGEGKLLAGSGRGASISDLFYNNKYELALYNLKDCELVWEIFADKQLIDFAVAKSQVTGLPVDRMGGSSASFDFNYLPLLHRKGYVAPSVGENKVDVISPGGFVLDSQPGLYRHVMVFDFKSLYPSIIRTFSVDPLAFWLTQHAEKDEPDNHIPGFNGATFSRADSILPDTIAQLWCARDKAKQDNDTALSAAIKIIMNSFYGVLGSPGCRFYDPRLASSITLRGHAILLATQQWLENAGLSVIYGDTDSLFVLLDDSVQKKDMANFGKELAERINNFWRAEISAEFGLTSYLELQFETHYERFFMPTIRGQEVGSKKRYAGLEAGAGGSDNYRGLIFKGLESVRSDWTALAREFQREVFWRVFNGEPVEEYISTVVEDLFNGKCDASLIYRKRLRQKVEDYDDKALPHIRTARLMRDNGYVVDKGDFVEYVITVQGAMPVVLNQAALDYDHYLAKQLSPAVDGLLEMLETSVSRITDRQISLI
jgi:DNA polymerase-2